MAEFKSFLFGTSGWSYEDWRGVFYPEHPGGSFDSLQYAAEYFDALEINSTFYRPPSPKTAASWARRTEHKDGFLFTAKLHQRFTHQRHERWSDPEASVFKRGMDPLAQAGKLGGILVQFPWSFRNVPENRKWLAAVIGEFKNYPLFIEVRHASWATDDFFGYLDNAGVGLVDIDQPLFDNSLAPSGRVTGSNAYVRLHGRNRENWFKEGAGRDARYDYLYDEGELAEWVKRIRTLSKKADTVFVFTNNHYRGQAAVNSLELKSLLTGEKLPVPPELLAAYPRAKQIATPGESQGQLL